MNFYVVLLSVKLSISWSNGHYDHNSLIVFVVSNLHQLYWQNIHLRNKYYFNLQQKGKVFRPFFNAFEFETATPRFLSNLKWKLGGSLLVYKQADDRMRFSGWFSHKSGAFFQVHSYIWKLF